VDEGCSILGMGREGIFFLRHRIQTVSGVQSPIQWVEGILTPEAKRPGSEADQSSISRAEVKKMRRCISTPPYIFMTLRLIKHRLSLHGVVLI